MIVGGQCRKDYVDYIKALGIILVVLGHINFANGFIKSWIYSFHMPIFFFATGLTTKKIDDVSICSIKKFVEKKTCSLMVPYILWGLIYAGLSAASAGKLLYGSYTTISGSGSLSSLWFLPAMFIAIHIAQAILILSEKIGNAVIPVSMIALFIISALLPEISIGYPFCFDAALSGTSFILLGILVEKLFVKVEYFKNVRQLSLVACVGFAGTFLYLVNPVNSDSYVLMAKMRIGNPICFIATAVCGCAMIYGVARLAGGIRILQTPLRFLGSNTLVIFAIQKPIIGVFEKVFTMIRIPILDLVITCIGTLLISCGVCVLINYFASCLAGKRMHYPEKHF